MKQYFMFTMVVLGLVLTGWIETGLSTPSVRASSLAVVTPSKCNLAGEDIIRAGPALGDLDKDGVNEIVVAGSDGLVYALNPDCTSVAGWPKQVNDYFVPPLVQMKSAKQDIESTPVLADVDADGWLEVIVAVGFMPQNHTNGGVIVFEHDGSVKPGWPKVTLDRHGAGDPPWDPDGYSDGVFATPAVGDVDGDGLPEIVYGAFDKCIYVWNGDGTPAAGWWNAETNQSARCLIDTVWSSAALADLDGDGVKDIVLGTDVHPEYKGGSVWALKGNNTVLWIVYTTQTIQSSPAVGDVNGDGYPEIVVGSGTNYPQGYMGYSDGNKVYAFDRFGNTLAGWPQATNASMFASPALADLDKDGKLEVLIGSGSEADYAATDKMFYIWRYDGTSFPGYPRTIPAARPWPAGQVSAGMPFVPLVADYDNNGVVDIFLVHASSWGVAAFPYNNPAALDLSKYLTSWALSAAPAINNLYNDGRLYMIVGGATSTGDKAAVYIWKISDTNSGAQPWPMSRRDALRTGMYPRQGALSVSSSSLYLLHQAGTTGSERASLYIANTGDESFTWSVTSKPSRVTISPSSGSPNQTITIAVDTAGLSNGLNTLGNIVINATGSGQTVLNAPKINPGNSLGRASVSQLPAPHSQIDGSNLLVKVLLLTPAFPPFPGGGERYAQALALQLMRRECVVTVVTSTACREQDFWQTTPNLRQLRHTTETDLRVVRCPLRRVPGGRAGLLLWRKAMVLLSALPGDQSVLLMNMARFIPPLAGLNATLAQLPDHFDVIHAFNLSWEYPMIEAWRLARRTHTPLVLTPFAHLGADKHDRVARNSTMDHQLLMLREAKAVLTLTNIERQGLGERGVTPDRMVTVGSGLDEVPALLDEEDILAHYHLSRPVVVFIGRASYDKGALHAAEAAIHLHRQGVAITLALIGSSTPEFERFLRGLPPFDREVIRPLGIVPEAHKHTLLQASTFLVLPSRTDSFGIVILEAWACRKPVIGARAGGIPEVIDEGHSGLLVNFGDVAGLIQAAKRLLQDEALCRALGQQGYAQLATQYTWDHVAEKVLAVYHRVS